MMLAAVAMSAVAWSVSGGGHLVIHVGLHKTSSTSTQLFLSSHSKMLDTAYGIKVAAAETAKSGAKVANTLAGKRGPYYSPKYLAACVHKIKGWLSKNSTVVLSSESFDRALVPVYKNLLARVGADNATAVVTLREPTSWLRSFWHLSMGHHEYQSFQSWLLEERRENLATPFTTVQNAREAFDRVDVISFDYLNYRGHTVASYLVCNVSLGVTQTDEYETCSRDVDQRVRRENPSSPPILRDLVRYANTAKKILGCPTGTKLRSVDYASADFAAFLQTLPTTCSSRKDISNLTEFFSSASNSYFGHMFQQSWDSWLSQNLHVLVENHPPSFTPKPICIVDDSKLTSEHWADIARLYLPTSCSLR